MSLEEQEIIEYIEENFLKQVKNNLKKVKESRKNKMLEDIKENFLDKVEYIQKNEEKTIDNSLLDSIIREFGNPKTVAKEYQAVFAQRDVYIFSPIIQIIIGVIFIVLEIYSYLSQGQYGRFYLLLIVPTLISIVLLAMGAATLILKKMGGNLKIRLIIAIVFVLLELYVIYFLISGSFSLLQMGTALLIFILVLIIFLISDYLQSISKNI